MGWDEMSRKEMKRGRVLGMKWLILHRGDETVSFEIDIWVSGPEFLGVHSNL